MPPGFVAGRRLFPRLLRHEPFEIGLPEQDSPEPPGARPLQLAALDEALDGTSADPAQESARLLNVEER